MPDLDVRPAPGQDVVVHAPPGTLLGPRVSYNKTHTRVRVKNTGTIAPDPDPVPPSEPAFLSRPASGNVVINGGTDVEITDKTFRGPGGRDNPVGIGITLRNVTRAWVHHCDFADLIGGLYTSNCTDVRMEDCRGRNIGDGTIGAGHSNYVQFADTTGGAIRRNRFLGGWTEDMISTWHSGGRPGDPLIIEYNAIQGLVSDTLTARAWKRGSGTGIIVSDGAGNARNGHVIVRHNTLLTPGQVGLQIIDGPGLLLHDNIVVAEKRPGNNNPMTTWEGNPQGVARDNRYWWTNDDGSHPDPWKHGGGGGMVFTNNVEDPTLKASDYVVVL